MDGFEIFKEEVKNRVDIVDVIGEFVELKKHGVNYIAPCPFHNETKPSFNVNRERQFFHCFGCGKGGDAITFLTEITGMSFMEALEQLAERAGMEMPKREAADPKRKEATEHIASANMAAAEYYHRTLNSEEGAAGLAYLTNRGLTPDTIRDFRLGFAPDDPTGLLAFVKSKGVTPADLDAAGLIKTRSYGGTPFNTFSGRIIFPIIDQTARVIGFGARLIEGEGAKYKNSPESPVYHKSRVLYGIYQARKELKRSHEAIVVEGYMDVITLHQAGITNVLAASGTAFTVDQGRAIARLARRVVLLFDGDQAGLKAAARSADSLLATDLDVKVAVLPEGDDPDSFVSREGLDKLREYLTHTEDIWTFKLRALTQGDTDPEAHLILAGEIADAIANIPDELKREVYIKDMSRRLKIDPDSMRKAVLGRVNRRNRARSNNEPQMTVRSGSGDEHMLLACMLNYDLCARKIIENVGIEAFKSPVYRGITEELVHRVVEGMDTSPSGLMSACTAPEAQKAISAAAIDTVDEKRAMDFIEDFIWHFHLDELHKEKADVSRSVVSETDPKKKAALVKRQQELQARIRELMDS